MGPGSRMFHPTLLEGFFLLRSQNQNSDWMMKLEGIASEVAARASCELYDLQFLGTGSGRTLQIFIDKTDVPVGIEDCSNVSRALNEVLDADESLIPGGPYNLEVSSPGLERDLRKEAHFHRVVGKKIWVKLSRPLGQILSTGVPEKTLENTKQLTSILKSSEADGIELELGPVPGAAPTRVKLSWDDVEKGKLVFEFDAQDEGGADAQKPNPKKKYKDHKKRVGK